MRPWRDIPRTAGLLLCCALLALGVVCRIWTPDATFQIYLKTLGAFLSDPTPALRATRLLPPPPTETLRLGIEPTGLDTLDFLALDGCAVQATILKRSSGLGRAARPSQRLLLELEYLRLAPACIAGLRDGNNDALAAILEDAWQQQRQQLPALIFNATLGSDEYRSFWQSHPAPEAYPRVKRRVALAALDAINRHVRRWLRGDYRAPNRDVEILLGEVAGGDGGALLQALSRQADWLSSADQMVASGIAGRSPCSTGKTAAAAVSEQYFTRIIQPRSARLERRYHALMLLIGGLEDQLSAALPERYRRWIAHRNQRLSALLDAPYRHLKQLERLRHRCSAEHSSAGLNGDH